MKSLKKGLNKRGQLTIFIIIAILIIALALLIYFLYPKIKGFTGFEAENPYGFIENCMREEIEDTVKQISSQGGDYEVNEKGAFFYRGEYIKFLCYTNENFVSCINQEPFLKPHIEKETIESINEEIEVCFRSLAENYEERGFDVQLNREDAEAEILPERFLVKFNREITITKGDETKKYKNFEISLNSNLYELTEIATNIVTWEIEYGDSVPEAYSYINPYIKIEKKRKEDDVKLYILTDRNTNEVFKFAVRSFALPPGIM